MVVQGVGHPQLVHVGLQVLTAVQLLLLLVGGAAHLQIPMYTCQTQATQRLSATPGSSLKQCM